jgi:hypothetical protein
MTIPKNFNSADEQKKILVNCEAKDGKEITQEECEYLNQQDKARESGREKLSKRSAVRDSGDKLCINCDIYPPFNKM